jgi:cobalt-zinc-cadmium resistance protein CzcA
MNKINFFDEHVRQMLHTIETVANKQLNNGEINYLEWTLLIQQTIDAQTLYFDYIASANQNLIHLYFLTNQN